jgi:TolA-binding protein
MRWGGAGLTAMLAVLFLVLLAQVRQQTDRIQLLQDKVQSLENARDLERTSAVEQQLRSTVQRLQALEGLDQRLQRLSLEQDSLRLQLRATGGAGLELDPPLDPGNGIRPGRPSAPLPELPAQQP